MMSFQSRRLTPGWVSTTLLIAAALLVHTPAQAQPPAIVSAPGVNSLAFRVTTFATGLHFPQSMQQLSDGSILVGTSNPTGGSFWSSTGELIRLVDADKNGVADGPGTLLYTGLPGMVTAVRQAGTLILATSAQSGSERISILRAGTTPADTLTLVGSINFTFPSGWDHLSYTLAVRRTPGSAANLWDVFFNVGSQYNFAASTQSIGVGGLITATVDGDAIYKVTIQDLGTSVFVYDLLRIASGLRNAAGIVVQPSTGDLYFADNGIDTPGNLNEPLSADELNHIAVADIGGTVENFGFPNDYIQYRTGKRAGSGGIQPLLAFQPISSRDISSESEGAVEIAFSPPAFPPELRNGIFVGFHGRWNLAGVANEENPLLHCDLAKGDYYDFVSNDEANVGHLNGLLSTDDSLFVADMTVTGGFDGGETGAIYQITVR
jgi:glucose/arabinose dehydrogenase